MIGYLTKVNAQWGGIGRHLGVHRGTQGTQGTQGNARYTRVHRGSDHITPTGDLIELEIICIYLEWRNTAPSVICDMFIEN